MQILPNQIPNMTSWNDQFIELFCWVRFLFLLNMYMSGPTKFLFQMISVYLVFGLLSLRYINLLAGLWRKKWTFCETLIVYVCISGLSLKMIMLKKYMTRSL